MINVVTKGIGVMGIRALGAHFQECTKFAAIYTAKYVNIIAKITA